MRTIHPILRSLAALLTPAALVAADPPSVMVVHAGATALDHGADDDRDRHDRDRDRDHHRDHDRDHDRDWDRHRDGDRDDDGRRGGGDDDEGSGCGWSSIWSGSAWADTRALPDVDAQVSWMVLRACPTRSENALLTLDHDKDVNVAFFTAGAWGSPTQVCADTAQHSERSIDAAYEQASGDALIAYWNNTPDKVGYRTWNGTTLSSEGTLALPSGTKLRYLRLFPKPASDTILLIALNDNSDLYAAAWSGGAWGPVSTLETSASTDGRECFSLAFESLSGQALLVYGEDDQNTPRYRTWDGSAWSEESSLPSVGAEPKWVRLAADPTSDRILFASLDSSKDLNANSWNGSAWGSNQELETDTGGDAERRFDLAFEGAGSTALIVYAEKDDDRLQYRTWSGTAWSGEQNGPDLRDQPRCIALTPGVGAGEVWILAADNQDDLVAARWAGGSMSAGVEISSNTHGESGTEPFMLAPSGAGSAGTASRRVIHWAEVKPQ